jgi:hypothetical protein
MPSFHSPKQEHIHFNQEAELNSVGATPCVVSFWKSCLPQMGINTHSFFSLQIFQSHTSRRISFCRNICHSLNLLFRCANPGNPPITFSLSVSVYYILLKPRNQAIYHFGMRFRWIQHGSPNAVQCVTNSVESLSCSLSACVECTTLQSSI